jgi:hypothetical protein
LCCKTESALKFKDLAGLLVAPPYTEPIALNGPLDPAGSDSPAVSALPFAGNQETLASRKVIY